jgi:hypothetical protein
MSNPENILVKIQNELKVPKTNVNAFGKYKYRSAEDILEAVKPILLRYNATLTLSDEIVAIGTKVFLKATAKINDTICYGYAETSEHKGMSAEQATGTASSYARKYALNGLFLIDETESDADSQKQPEQKNESKPMLTPETLKKMITAIQEGKSDKVKEAMENYTISGPQSNVLKLALINV